MTNQEIIRDVVGYEGLYSIDIFGNVICLSNNTEMKQQINKFGYANVSLRKNGKQKQYKVHRLIAEAFIPNPQNKEQVNHIDGNKLNNVVWNLEWNTCKENIRHAVAIGKHRSIHIKVIETGKEYKSITECVRDIGGNVGNIYACIQGRRKSCNGYHFRRI